GSKPPLRLGAPASSNASGRPPVDGGASAGPRTAAGAVPGPGLTAGGATAARRAEGLRRGGAAGTRDAGAGQPDLDLGPPGTGHPGSHPVPAAHPAQPGP